jgi:hypothetical protein
MSPPPLSGSSEAVVIIKAAPQVGQRHGETVCCAGLDLYGNWLRLYPVSFRLLEDSKKFARWDRIRFKWRRPQDDARIESLRVDQDSIEIIDDLKRAERERFLTRSIVTSLNKEREAGRSLALLKPEVQEFVVERKTADEIRDETGRFQALRAQADLFAKAATPYHPCPYRFRYRYRIDDGERFGTCQDRETEATFFKWSREYSEAGAIERMVRIFGEDYPRRGMLLAMGTHSQYPETWLINGVIRLPDSGQGALFLTLTAPCRDTPRWGACPSPRRSGSTC